MQTPPIAFLYPLLLAALATLCTIAVHGLAVMETVHFIRFERKLGRAGVSFWNDFVIVALAIFIGLIAHLVEIGVWAGLFFGLREFHDLGTAYYHSAVNYTTLGYGDLLLTPRWRLLGPLEAADGMLMFGVSAAMIFALIQGLIQARFVDLRS